MIDRFKWCGRSTVTRSKEGSSGFALEQGHIYNTADFDAAVVGEWIATGNAEEVTARANHTVLEVHSAIVKSKAPKIGANS